MALEHKDIEIEKFLYGKDPTEGIINIEYDYSTNQIILILENPETGALTMKQTKLKPFLWTKELKNINFYGNDKKLVRKKMTQYGIITKPLDTMSEARNENGYKYLVSSTITTQFGLNCRDCSISSS